MNYRGIEADYQPLIWVIDEVLEWFDAGAFESATQFSAQPIESLSAELLLGLGNVGPSVRALLAGSVEDAERTVRAWPSSAGPIEPPNELQPLGGAVRRRLCRYAHRSDTQRTISKSASAATAANDALRSVLAKVRAQLGTVNALVAAWSDLVAAYRRGEAAWSRAERRADFLAATFAVGHEGDWLRSELCGLIMDRGTDVSWARSLRDGSVSRFTHEAGEATAEELNDLISLTLRQQPPEGECVVWMDFEHASLGDRDHLLHDGMEFWDARSASELVESDVSLIDSSLRELRAEEHRILVPPQSPGIKPNSVWARVPIGRRHGAGAVEEARFRAMLLADLAAVRIGGPRWSEGGWSAVLIDGRSAVGGGWGVPPHVASSYPPFDSHIAAVGQSLCDVVDDVGSDRVRTAGHIAGLWATIAPIDNPHDRLLAIVRLIERVLPGGLRNRILRRQIPEIHALDVQADSFSRGLGHFVSMASFQGGWTQDPTSVFGEQLPDRWPRFYHHELVPLLPRLRSLLSDYPEYSVDLANAETLRLNEEVRRKELERLRERHDVSWARVIRHRNALTHGMPAPSRTGVAAVRTADSVAAEILEAALIAANIGSNVASVVERTAKLKRRQEWAHA